MNEGLYPFQSPWVNLHTVYWKEKSTPVDLVTKYDRQVEELVLKRLRPRCKRGLSLAKGVSVSILSSGRRTAAPEFRVLAEETANKEELRSQISLCLLLLACRDLVSDSG